MLPRVLHPLASARGFFSDAACSFRRSSSIVRFASAVVGLTYVVYAGTASPVAAAVCFASQITPVILFNAADSLSTPNWKRSLAFFDADIARALCVLPVLALQGHPSLWIVSSVAFLSGALWRLSDNHRNVSAPRVDHHPHPSTALLISSIRAAFGSPRTGLPGSSLLTRRGTWSPAAYVSGATLALQQDFLNRRTCPMTVPSDG